MSAGEGGVVLAEVVLQRRYRQEEGKEKAQVGQAQIIVRASFGGKRVECSVEEFTTNVKAVYRVLIALFERLMKDSTSAEVQELMKQITAEVQSLK